MPIQSQPIRLGGDFYVTVNFTEFEGKSELYAVIESATIEQDDSLIMPITLDLSNEQGRDKIKTAFRALTGYPEAFFSLKDAIAYDNERHAENQEQEAWELEQMGYVEYPVAG